MWLCKLTFIKIQKYRNRKTETTKRKGGTIPNDHHSLNDTLLLFLKKLKKIFSKHHIPVHVKHSKRTNSQLEKEQQHNTLAREDKGFDGGVKDTISVRLKPPSLNRGRSLKHNLASTYNTVQSSLPKQVNTHSHLRHVTLTTHLMTIKWFLWAFV